MAREKGIDPEKLPLSKAWEMFLMGMDEKKFAQIVEDFENPVSSIDGLSDEDWVNEGAREYALKRL